MLRELRIKDYAIIDEVSLCFEGGLNVITGETGTGKSILVEAISLILGGRFSNDVIRQGEEEAILEARFDPVPLSSPADDPAEWFILKRVLSRPGKNRAYLNGSLANLSSLRQVGQKSVEIHGQQENHNLTDINRHLYLLDSFGRILDKRSRYLAAYRDWSRLRQERNELEKLEVQGKRQTSFIEYQLSEIQEAKLTPGEDESLEKEERFLENWGSIVSTTQKAYSRLSSEEGGIFALLDEAERAIEGLHAVTSDASAEIQLLESSKIHLKELAISLRDRLQHVDHDPGRLQEVRERLYLIQRLKKKYGLSSVTGILDFQRELEADLSRISGSEVCRLEMDKRLDEMETHLRKEAITLSQKRAEAREELEKKVKDELDLLGMEKTAFKISFQQIALCETGVDRIEFLIAQPGETPQGIAKVASGGELSRMMLALKVVLAEADPVPSLIFDEVDAGIGGAVAERVGRRLSRLAKRHQVFCITHLPQIACLADHHYFVEKKMLGNRIATSVEKLSKEKRILELARMLGGVTITPITLRHAAEMIRLQPSSAIRWQSQQIKRSRRRHNK